MSHAHIDTDVLIRLLSGDDPAKQADAAALMQQVDMGEVTVVAPVTVIADTVHVLASPRLYRVPRSEIADALIRVVSAAGFRVRDRPVVLRALTIYGSTGLDFGDAMIVASMEQDGTTVLYSYDRDFDHIPGIERHEPPGSTG